MKILYSTDDNYSKICYASINSLFESNKNVNKLAVYIIDNNISKSMKKKISELALSYKRELFYISCKRICKNLIKNNSFPISAYARLFIQNEIEDDKVIYIDCDTLVNNDLTDLWNINLNNNWVGGVIDPLPNYLKTAVGMEPEDSYINSGVLIINLLEWRKNDFKSKVIKFIEEHDYNVVHHDQGIINGICKNRVMFIHPKYNLMPEFIYMNEKKIKRLYKLKYFYNNNELEEAKTSPSIVHFISKFYNRPWFKECTHPYKDKFNSFYFKVSNNLSSNPLSKKVILQKFVYEKLPFVLFVIIERLLDIKRRRLLK